MRRTLTAAAIAATFGVYGIANAQLDTSPNNITVRAGVALPADSTLNAAGNTFMNLGVEYIFGDSLLKGGETYLSIDAFFNNFQNVVAWPVMVNQRFFTGSNPQGKRNYFFIGVGMSFVNVTSSGGGIGARAGVGTELGPNIIAEIAGYVSDRIQGTRANAVTFDIGYRF